MKAGTQLGKVTMLVTAIVRYLTCLDCLPVSHQTLPILLYISVIWFNCMVTIVLDFAPTFLVFFCVFIVCYKNILSRLGSWYAEYGMMSVI